MNLRIVFLALSALTLSGLAGVAAPPSAPVPAAAEKKAPTPLEFTVKRIDGREENLSIYAGKVVVIVNVASRCGYTRQYRALQAMYETHKDAGLVILGFPANDFMGQEPGSNEEIAALCAKDYGVTFPMFEKITVKGKDRHPLYACLAASPGELGGEPKWNFTKFVLDREGRVAARFDAKGNGGDRARLEPGLESKVEQLLSAKP